MKHFIFFIGVHSTNLVSIGKESNNYPYPFLTFLYYQLRKKDRTYLLCLVLTSHIQITPNSEKKKKYINSGRNKISYSVQLYFKVYFVYMHKSVISVAMTNKFH